MTNSIDQQFVEYIVKSLVGKPDAVKIDRRVDEKGVLLELTVDPEDLGRVIGKRGATAQSLRTLLRALGTKNEARYNLKIVDNGEPRPPREDREDRPESQAPVQADEPQDDSPVQNDDAQDDTQTPAPAQEEDTFKDEVEDVPAEVASDEDDSDRYSRTRKELEDLDDLDI